MKKHTLTHKSRLFRRFLRADEAVSALEYAILVGVVAVAVGAAIVTFSGNLSDTLEAMGTEIETITIESTGAIQATP